MKHYLEIYAKVAHFYRTKIIVYLVIFQELFMGRFIEHMTRYQRTSYSEISASLWLSLRLQVISEPLVYYFIGYLLVHSAYVMASAMTSEMFSCLQLLLFLSLL